MRCTPERAVELLEQWRVEGSWIFAVIRFADSDEHRFWCRIRSAEKQEIWLAGESAMVSLRVDQRGCQYSESSTLPAEVATQHPPFSRCLTIESDSFLAALGALNPDAPKQ
jgi:hypothetical protein